MSTTSTTTTTTLLLIDVQKDFHPPGGSLAIPTADEDANRIATLIRQHGVKKVKFDRIIVTMDTHPKLHIAHPSFWSQHPKPFTIITADDIRNGIWTPRTDIRISKSAIDETIFTDEPIPTITDDDNEEYIDLKQYSILYTTKLEQMGRFKLCIWPEHCLIGSSGHNIVDNIQEALYEWMEHTGKNVEYVMKGQHQLTEMYSVMKAEIPITNETSFNTSLQDSFLTKTKQQQQQLVVCGQAMSHCVNYTLRDIVSHNWPSTDKDNIVLLTDCASSVPGFEDAANKFQTDMSNLGVQLKTSTEFMSSMS